MLIISIIFGIGGVISQFLYLQDWWRPLTITGTAVGIEDFLIGFLIGGLSSVVYSVLFNKKVKIKKVKKVKEQKRNIHFIIIFGLLLFTFVFSFFLLRLNSFFATVFAFLIPTIVIYSKRKDLIKNSILSGLATLIISIIVYYFLDFITPGFFDKFWFFENIGHIFVIGIPLEEIIWFFLAGAFIGPLYEYWKEGKLINMKR